MKNWLIEYSCPDVLYLRSVVLTFFLIFLNRYRQNNANLIRTQVISHTDKDIAVD